MKYLTYLPILAILLTTLFACGSKNEKVMDKRTYEERWMMLNVSLINRDFSTALLYIDTLQKYYPEYHTLYFSKGWVYSMENKPKEAKKNFLKALEIIDKDLKRTKEKEKRDGLWMNRAFMMEVLYGRETYMKTLDSMKSVLSDTMCLELLKNEKYEKENMFYGKAYQDEDGKWHCMFLQPGDTISIEKMKQEERWLDSVKNNKP